MADIYRLKLHIQPPSGWLNDPNGLCQYKGIYHVFYQYSINPIGDNKCWGHKTTSDFIHWNTEETKLLPDQKFDRDGVYSGSALISDGKMYLYYTGNVKNEGNYNYITNGRESNLIMVESSDGYNFSGKKLLMTNEDYPRNYSCHIRDPKVWKVEDSYYMLLGARKRNDKGGILVYKSKDGLEWKLSNEVSCLSDFGYMWECPDYFNLDNVHVLSFSPQGLKKEKFRFQNVYQSGYVFLDGEIQDINQNIENINTFVEWDNGFDFYAPQTFCDESGRRIIIGWAGICDADYHNDKTVEKGWQHALTIPRELTVKNNKIYQNPIREMESLRETSIKLYNERKIILSQNIFEINAKSIERNGKVLISCNDEYVCLQYNFDGEITLLLSKGCGCGRQERYAKCDEVKNIRMIVDTSLLEIFVNDGEITFTTRFYFENNDRNLKITGMEGTVYYLNSMTGN
jgi:beta-fructofuranosidase